MSKKESGKMLELDDNSKEIQKKEKKKEKLRCYKEPNPNFLSNY